MMTVRGDVVIVRPVKVKKNRPELGSRAHCEADASSQ